MRRAVGAGKRPFRADGRVGGEITRHTPGLSGLFGLRASILRSRRTGRAWPQRGERGQPRVQPWEQIRQTIRAPTGRAERPHGDHAMGGRFLRPPRWGGCDRGRFSRGCATLHPGLSPSMPLAWGLGALGSSHTRRSSRWMALRVAPSGLAPGGSDNLSFDNRRSLIHLPFCPSSQSLGDGC